MDALTRRREIESALRALSARHSPIDDTWTANVITSAGPGYLQVLIEDETESVFVVQMNTFRQVHSSAEFDSQTSTPVIVGALQAAARP